MRKSLIIMLALVVGVGLLLVMVSGSRPSADGADAGATSPHALVDD